MLVTFKNIDFTAVTAVSVQDAFCEGMSATFQTDATR